MSEYRLEFTPAAYRQLEALPLRIRKRISVRIDGLISNPRPAGCTKLKGSDDLYRIRTGDYRILYQVKDDNLPILVVKVGHGREVYKKIR